MIESLNCTQVTAKDEMRLVEEYKNNKFHPFRYHLKKVKWIIFGTLTFKSPGRRIDGFDAEYLRRKDFNALIGAFCGRFKLRKKHLVVYRATERGGGECHQHFLIGQGNLNPNDVNLYCQFLRESWISDIVPVNQKLSGAGTAKIVPYDEAREFPAVSYCLKKEFDRGREEVERFDHLSPALHSMIKNRDFEEHIAKRPEERKEDVYF
jgi:hypothetical protein